MSVYAAIWFNAFVSGDPGATAADQHSRMPLNVGVKSEQNICLLDPANYRGAASHDGRGPGRADIRICF